jgi:Holliday junction resolvase RusA-like endonuclease
MHKRLLFDFVVTGAAVSFQTKNKNKKAAWKDSIRKHAKEEWTRRGFSQPLTGRLRIVVTYFTAEDPLAGSGAVPDSDNALWTVAEVLTEPEAVKPLKDSMQGLIYIDDRQIVETQCRIKNLNGNFTIRRMSPVIAEGFFAGGSFTYIKFTTPSDPSELDTINDYASS